MHADLAINAKNDGVV